MGGRYRFDDVEIDLNGFRLLKDGEVVPVEPKALKLLIFLVENRGRLVHRRELIDAVWSGAFVSDHVLNRAIGQLRKLLVDDAKAPRYVETVPTLGYRFVADVEPEGPSPAIPATITPGKVSDPLAAEQSALPRLSNRERESNESPLGKPVVSAIDSHQIQGIAVLPLEDFSGISGNEYFADGMTEALITSLAKIKSLRVISRTSVMRYKKIRKPLPQIARELNVDAVIEGSVLRSGDRVRIAAQLIHEQRRRQGAELAVVASSRRLILCPPTAACYPFRHNASDRYFCSNSYGSVAWLRSNCSERQACSDKRSA